MILAAILLSHFSKLTSRHTLHAVCPCLDVKHVVAHRLVGNRDRPQWFRQIPEKKVGQHCVITFAIDGNRISCLISNEISPDDAIIPQSAPNGQFLAMQLHFLNHTRIWLLTKQEMGSIWNDHVLREDLVQ